MRIKGKSSSSRKNALPTRGLRLDLQHPWRHENIGRLLLRLGKISVAVDSNAPIPGLVGIYTERRGRKYFKGPHRPQLADLTDTELVLYGP